MRNILITGASSGIGETTARYLANIGCSLVLIGRNEKKLQAMCDDLGPNVKYFVYDLNDLANIENIFRFCKENNIKLDGIVYSAGIVKIKPLKTENIDSIMESMRINTMAFVEMVRIAVNRKYSEDGMSIVAISSIAAQTCFVCSGAYSMSKSAMNAACRVFAKELLRRKIRINTIMPANVRTPRAETMDHTELIKLQPLGFVEPEEVSYLIEFLLSDKSCHITGAGIPISAGMDF